MPRQMLTLSNPSENFRDETAEGAPLRSSRFIDILKDMAKDPRRHRVAFRHPSYKGEYLNTSFLQFYNAVINTASKLRGSLEKADGAETSVGYISNSHISYPMNLFGLMKLGLIPVMLSPRNPIESQVHLLNSAGATKLVYDPAYSDMAIQCQKQMPTLVIIEAVTFDPSLYTPPQTPNLPLGCLESDAYERIVLVMHSSGTTGVPKLIRISNRYALNIIRRYRMNQDWCQKLQGTMLIMSPIFHLFGLVNFIWFFSNFDRVVFPISFSPNHILNISEEAGVSLILLLPYQLKQLAEYCTSVPKKWSILARMNGLHFGGAPLAADLGRTFLSHNICLLNGYGTTETGFMAGGISGPENPDCCKLTLVHGLRYKLCNNYDDTAQLCILSDDENLATDLCKGQDGYLLADRLRILNQDGSRVHFEVLHRVDDTLVHPTGEKTYPVSMENSLLMSPLITRCVVLNEHHTNNCLLIQLSKEAFSQLPLLAAMKHIYAAVERVNSAIPDYSRIDQDLIYILPINSDKELPVTFKGNVSRSESSAQFKSEIEQLYSNFHNLRNQLPLF